MIEIKTLEFRNFQSYGDYVTKLPIGDIGPALIVGDDLDKPGRKNGTGKTTIPESILWCLFGKVTRRAKPGDHIVNWSTGKNCYVEVETECGYKIRRTRKFANHSDLLIYKPDGTDVSSSTNPNAQAELNRIFGLDYDIFTAGTFFAQFGKSLMELTEPKRKEIMERMLHISYMDEYANVAKEKRDWTESEQEKTTYKRNQLERDILSIEGQVRDNEISRDSFEDRRKNKLSKILEEQDQLDQRFTIRIREKNNNVKEVTEKLASATHPDESIVEKLKVKWGMVEQIEGILETKKQEFQRTEVNKRVKQAEASRLAGKIEDYVEQTGTVCPKCEQKVPKDHTDDLSAPVKAELTTVSNEVSQFQLSCEELSSAITEISNKLSSSKPDATVSQATTQLSMAKSIIENLENRKNQIESEILQESSLLESEKKKLEERLEEAKQEKNPYGQIIGDLTLKKEEKSSAMSEASGKVTKFNTLINHLSYIHSVYKDRKKLRSFILSKSIPYFNSQIAYYLNAFELELSIEFNTYLQAKTKKWPYHQFSGGEGKRADLSIMFAILDLHISMYGQMSNILVFDEVDGRLCDEGIDGFINILFNDLMGKPSSPKTALVISHRPEMRDAFPTKILVTKKDGQSHIEEIR